MVPDVNFGDVQLLLDPGDHICAFYNTPDMRDAMMIPFLREGLESGDKCVCYLQDSGAVISKLIEPRPDLYPAPAQIEFRDADVAYLTKGRFSEGVMIGRLERDVTMALDDGYSFARVVGDMSWVTEDSVDPRRVFAYEAQLNEFGPRYPQFLLCLYDLTRFDGSLVVDVLKTHPKILLNGLIVRNPYYIRTADFIASRDVTNV